MSRAPLVMRFEFDETSRAIGGVGRLVKADCFPDAPPFRCNVVFASGRGRHPLRGGYADPWSPWFNVFYGGYQVDTAVATWHRPFGFRPGEHGFEPDAEELQRLGRADWDYLTAYPYGVPLEVIRARRAEAGTPAAARIVQGGGRSGGRSWDLVHVDEVTVVSGYVAADGAALCRAHPVWSPLWQGCFGRPTPRPDHPASFPAVAMRASFYVSWDRQGPWYRTFVCGGAVGHAVDDERGERLLAAQLRAVRPLMELAGAACRS